MPEGGEFETFTQIGLVQGQVQAGATHRRGNPLGVAQSLAYPSMAWASSRSHIRGVFPRGAGLFCEGGRWVACWDCSGGVARAKNVGPVKLATTQESPGYEKETRTCPGF